MKNFLRLISLIALIAIMIPHFADARAGGGRSKGSMGSHTFSPSRGAPIQRSTTTRPNPQQNNWGNRQTPNAPLNAPNTGSPFWRGFGGGLLGAGIGSLLFGGMAGAAHGGAAGAGGAAGGLGGMFGGLFSILIIGGIIYFIYKMFTRSRSNMFNSRTNSQTNYVPSTNAENQPTDEVTNTVGIIITDNDRNYFGQSLLQIQHLWSEGDIAKLRQFVTPEMLQYFSEELSSNSSQGLMNKVEQVKLIKSDVIESWHEYDLDYATIELQWSAIDYIARLDANPSDSNYVVSGSKSNPEQAEEIWTFVRSNGGKWMLSAIQQIGN